MRKELLLKSRIFCVERREYLREGKPPVIRDLIIHPGAVVILPVLDDGRIVLIRNFRYSVEQELLELPAGTLEPGEPPVETARRELQEETGYQAGRIEPFIEFFSSPGILIERMYTFVATDLTHVGQNLQGSERITVQVEEADKVRQMLVEGRLEDGKTIAVLGLYFARQRG